MSEPTDVTPTRVADERRPFSPVWWVVLVTLGVLLGVFAPAFGILAVEQFGMPVWLAYPLVVLSGALMGLIVGIAQGGALHRTVLGVPRAGWALLTAMGGLVAWALGTLPLTLEAAGQTLELEPGQRLAALVVGAVVAVLAIPGLQWLQLRRVVRGAWLWIPINIVAVAVGLALAWVVSNLADLADPTSALAGALFMAGVLALAFATVTGLGLDWLGRRPRRAQDAPTA
ncbi:MAG: hypothetical protein Q4F65_08405 [Propionibacteriaceae bacterium]|nr:hypothetical protein [Propionibacteriaceae bacterium]